MARWSAARVTAPCVPPPGRQSRVYVGITMITAALIGLLTFSGMLALPSKKNRTGSTTSRPRCQRPSDHPGRA